jgi:hypothetical protein
MLKSLFMRATCFYQYWSSSGATKIADETAVVSSMCIVSVRFISILCMT